MSLWTCGYLKEHLLSSISKRVVHAQQATVATLRVPFFAAVMSKAVLFGVMNHENHYRSLQEGPGF